VNAGRRPAAFTVKFSGATAVERDEVEFRALRHREHVSALRTASGTNRPETSTVEGKPITSGFVLEVEGREFS